jgi:glyceraldehyde-3-phosphate dehydrogenase/erythrose-4-phosphate dehydrogenase
MKVALVGYGSIAKFWIEAIEKNTDFELIAVHDAYQPKTPITKWPFYLSFDEYDNFSAYVMYLLHFLSLFNSLV